MAAPLDGLDEIAWAELGHAYGPASDVPGLLRALTSADPAERERALDALYGGVHHQGDVYDSTLACLPFLCALASDPAVPDRDRLLDLLDSIATTAEWAVEYADGSIPDPQATIAACTEEDEELLVAHALLAGRQLAERLPGLTPLLADPLPEVRGTAAGLLARRYPDPAGALRLLTDRASAERDTGVRQALAGSAGAVARRLGDRAGAAADLLLRLASPEEPPAAVLTALAGLARHAPDALPEATVERAASALDLARAAATAPPPVAGPERPDTATMLSYLRGLHTAAAGDDVTDERTSRALDSLLTALGDRIEERHALVLHTLRHGDPAGPAAAVERAAALHSGWRVPGAEQTAELLHALLTGPDRRAALAAARELRACRLPLSDRLLDTAAALASTGPAELPGPGRGFAPGWDDWRQSLPGQAALLLVSAGDGRAVEVLAPLLAEWEAPRELAQWCEQLGPYAAGLVEPLARRVEVLGDRLAATESFDDAGVREMARLLGALIDCGLSRVGDLAGRLLAQLHERREDHPDTFRAACDSLLGHPGGLGPQVAEAVPLLRLLVADPSPRLRLMAVRALWHAGEEAEPLLPVLADLLADREGSGREARHQALDLAAGMAWEAAPLTAALVACLADPEQRTAVRAALALRAVVAGPGPEAAVPAEADALLTAVWAGARELRPVIAAGLVLELPDPSAEADLEPAAEADLERRGAPGLPAGLAGLLRAELAERRRVGNTGSGGARMRYDCATDEQLRTDCHRLLDAARD
ncbi:hypothetical protein [Kitasatospora camelliae]|uniref:HEAT repeat protein n=1 Tax=Kitasatospora camelliae TaxID=3156397 RepID=A0AAU8JNS7_9ACTN